MSRVALTLLAVLIVAGCGTSQPSSAGSNQGSAPAGHSTPPPASCHYRTYPDGTVGPDLSCTPGELNPAAVADPKNTICVRGYATQVRPPVQLTERWKRLAIRQYGAPGPPSDYEYDHLVAIEDGGAPADQRNLWPEPRTGAGGAAHKDLVENRLHKLICSGRMTIQQAATILAGDWKEGLAKRSIARIALDVSAPWAPSSRASARLAVCPSRGAHIKGTRQMQESFIGIYAAAGQKLAPGPRVAIFVAGAATILCLLLTEPVLRKRRWTLHVGRAAEGGIRIWLEPPAKPSSDDRRRSD